MSLWAGAKRMFTGRNGTKSDLYYRVAVLGGNSVGKTSMISQFRQKEVPDNPASYGINREVYETSNANVHLNILDTSGVNSVPMLKIAIHNSDAFLLVYSIDDTESYQYAQTLLKQIVEVKMNQNVPIVLVANKKDLIRESMQETGEIPMHGQCGYSVVEISSLSYDDVCEAFEQVMSQLNQKVSLTSVLQRRRKSEVIVRHNRRQSIRDFLSRVYNRSSI